VVPGDIDRRCPAFLKFLKPGSCTVTIRLVLSARGPIIAADGDKTTVNAMV